MHSKKKYSTNHEWVELDTINNLIGYIGISTFAKKELGDIIYLDIDYTILKKEIGINESFGTIEAVKTVSDLFMPISGKIIEINNKLLKNPEKINNNIWIIKINIKDIKEYNNLLSLEEYEKYYKKNN